MFGRSIREGREENEEGEQQRKEEMDGESRRRGNEEMKQRREAETEDERWEKLKQQESVNLLFCLYSHQGCRLQIYSR